MIGDVGVGDGAFDAVVDEGMKRAGVVDIVGYRFCCVNEASGTFTECDVGHYLLEFEKLSYLYMCCCM